MTGRAGAMVPATIVCPADASWLGQPPSPKGTPTLRPLPAAMPSRRPQPSRAQPQPPPLLLPLLLAAATAHALVPPHFPRVFSASLEVTTKHLNKSNVYPPAWRTIDVDYDFVHKRARAYVQTSYEKRQKTNGTTTLRRYDLGKEWEIAQFGKEMVCKWSRILNAKMPRPHLFDPDLQLDQEQVTRKVDGKDEKCLHWSQAGVDGSVRRGRTPPHSSLPSR
jgi:hypothetical protein